MDKTTLKESYNMKEMMKYPTAPQRPIQTALQNQNSYVLIVLPHLQASIASYQEISIILWFLQWKKSPAWMSISSNIVGCLLGASILVSHHKHAGESAELNH